MPILVVGYAFRRDKVYLVSATGEKNDAQLLTQIGIRLAMLSEWTERPL
jgi:hypothetical protein